MKNENEVHQFCQSLITLGLHRSRAMANYVMGLASSPGAQTPVDLSMSEFCHYHYSNQTKVLENWELSESDFRGFLRPYIPLPRVLENGSVYYAFTHDVTKMLKPFSPCLEDRQYVATSNNVIEGNRPLGIGYPVSVLHLGVGESGWCPPLSAERLGSAAVGHAVAVRQVKDVLGDRSLPFGDVLGLLRADSAYCKAVILAPLYGLDNLVQIIRFRAGMKVWFEAGEGEKGGSGAPRIYGEKYYLADESAYRSYRRKGQAYEVWQAAIGAQAADDEVRTAGVLGNGREVVFWVKRWKDVRIRSKPGHSMKDKPMDMLRIMVLDAHTQLPVFNRPLFVGICGKRKEEIGTAEGQRQYRERYEVEPYYNFAKNRLLLDKLQTPVLGHLDTWLRIVQVTSWLLFVASGEIGTVDCPVWQKYLPANKNALLKEGGRLTIAQTQRASHLVFSTLDKTPFLPLECKKGKGRKLGDKIAPKKHFKPVKKMKKSIIKMKNQQNE